MEIITSPQNLLLAVGDRDNIVTKASVLNLLKTSTGGGEQIDKLYGNFSEGTARKMIVSPGTDHAAEMLDPYIVQEAISWIETSLDISTSPSSILFWPNISLTLSMIGSLLSVFPAIACVKGFGRLIRKDKSTQKIKPTRSGVIKLVFFYLVAWGSVFPIFLMFIVRLGVTNLTLMLFSGITLFRLIPVIFADSFVTVYVIASIMFLLFIIVFRRSFEKIRFVIIEFKRSSVLGTLGFLVTFLSLNVVFTQNIIDLFPTTREFSLMMMLFPLFLPLILMDELWLRNLQNRLSQYWQKIAIPVILYLLPKVAALTFVSFIFGNLVLIASAILFIPALFTAWLFNESRSVIGGVIFNALLFAWVIAVVLPFGGYIS